MCWRTGPVYPRRLVGDPEAPAVLFCQGDPVAINRNPTVAIVGTRSPTRYGIGVAAQFAADLAAMGVSIVSGLALGIDGAAHEGATTAGAPPIAVVAGGFGHVGQEEFARGGDEIGELRLGQCGDFTKRIDAARESYLGFEDIAESGEGSLI